MPPNVTSARKVTVDLPSEAFEVYPWDPDGVAHELRLLWLLDLVRQRRMGHGKAAELAGLPRSEFLRLMGKHNLTPFDYDEDELADELGA